MNDFLIIDTKFREVTLKIKGKNMYKKIEKNNNQYYTEEEFGWGTEPPKGTAGTEQENFLLTASLKYSFWALEKIWENLKPTMPILSDCVTRIHYTRMFPS